MHILCTCRHIQKTIFIGYMPLNYFKDEKTDEKKPENSSGTFFRHGRMHPMWKIYKRG